MFGMQMSITYVVRLCLSVAVMSGSGLLCSIVLSVIISRFQYIFTI